MASVAKYIAKGSYGCVIKPAYDCNEQLLTDDNTISKLFINRESWEKEVKINTIIRQLDENNNFTVKMINSCEIKNNYNIKKICNLNDNNIYQILYEYGGKEIIDIFRTNEILDMVAILKKFINIFEGLCILDKNNIIHQDIKPNNILYNNKFYLIDFGLYITKTTKYISNEESIYKFIYYPSEYAFLYYYEKNAKLGKINAEFYKDEIETNINLLLGKNNINNTFKQKFKDIFDNLDKDKTNIFNIIKINTDIHDKIDVYMFGLTLYEFLIATFVNCTEQNNISNIPIGIFDLIGNMTNINPYERITIHEATRQFKLLFNLN